MNAALSLRALLSATAPIVQLLVIAMLLERALAFVFEYYWFERVTKGVRGLKAAIVLSFAAFLCFAYRFDVLARLMESDPNRTSSRLGIAVTSVVLSGCTLAAIAVLQGRFNWSKPSRNALIRAKQVTASAVANEARARDIAARALVAEAESRRLRAERELADSRVESPAMPSPTDSHLSFDQQQNAAPNSFRSDRL